MSVKTPLDLSHDCLDLLLGVEDGLVIERLASPGTAELVAGGTGFAVTADGVQIDGRSVAFLGHRVTELKGGAVEHVVSTQSQEAGLRVDWHLVTYPGVAVLETWPVVHNESSKAVMISRVDSVSAELVADQYQLLSFAATGSCTEFAPSRRSLDSAGGSVTLGSLSGRSSNGDHPYFVLSAADGRKIVGCVAWSGNWTIRMEPNGVGYRLSGGLHDTGFSKLLEPGAHVEAPPVVLALGAGEDATRTSGALVEVGRRWWYPPVDDRFPPTEWNHWWPYVDVRIDEKTFLANVEEAARLGLEVCTLDAGWFGPSDADAKWFDYRGDWDLVNWTRFPSGLRLLSDHTHRHGMRFGLWCEIEGLGAKAQLAATRPDLPATRGDERLGYVCFGNPEAREWALATMERLLVDYAVDWLKLDFNVDPGLGCDRTDHGHGEGDGLFEHYVGYYAVLDEMRRRHPDLVLENCSSGGLRIDVGIARRTHITYLSDPDWPEHSLQVFWAALRSLSPDRGLHWAYSEWFDRDYLPHQKFDPTDPTLTPRQLDFYTRISMLHAFGLSQRLPDLPDWVADRYRSHIALYKELVRPYLREAEVLELTEQTLRDGQGDRWAGFQYALPTDDHLLFVFRLDHAETVRTIHPRRLRAEQVYVIDDLGRDVRHQRTGAELLAGMHFDHLEELDSSLLRISPLGSGSAESP